MMSEVEKNPNIVTAANTANTTTVGVSGGSNNGNGGTTASDQQASRFKHFWEVKNSAGNGLRLNYIWHCRQFAFALVPGLFVLVLGEGMKYKMKTVEQQNMKNKKEEEEAAAAAALTSGAEFDTLPPLLGPAAASAASVVQTEGNAAQEELSSASSTSAMSSLSVGELAARLDVLQHEITAVKSQLMRREGQQQHQGQQGQQSPILQRNMASRGLGLGLSGTVPAAAAAPATDAGTRNEDDDNAATTKIKSNQQQLTTLFQLVLMDRLRAFVTERFAWVRKMIADPFHSLLEGQHPLEGSSSTSSSSINSCTSSSSSSTSTSTSSSSGANSNSAPVPATTTVTTNIRTTSVNQLQEKITSPTSPALTTTIPPSMAAIVTVTDGEEEEDEEEKKNDDVTIIADAPSPFPDVPATLYDYVTDTYNWLFSSK